jgi:hypothetical protein
VKLYHYTCDHGAERIGPRGTLKPQPLVGSGTAGVAVWMTDLDVPFRDALGLTSHILDCDRTAHQYVVHEPRAVMHWTEARKILPRQYVRALESAPGAMPMHWYVSGVPQAAVRADGGAADG